MTFATKTGKGLCLIGSVLWLASTASGQEPAITKDDKSTVSFVWENDSFAGTDRNYTNGIRLSWLSGTQDAKGVSAWVADMIGADDDAVRRWGVAFGQTLFTPEDIQATEFIDDQQPYAAWLYAELNAVLQRANSVDTFALQVGVIGPGAAGEFAQNQFHALLGLDQAQGWDNQLGSEVGVNLLYDKKMRRIASIGDSTFAADLTPNLGFTLGTVRTNAHAGLTLRLGQDLDNDFGPPRVAPALGGAGYFTPKDKFSWYVFGGVEGRAVVHNLFIDGSLFRDDISTLSGKTFVADYQAGVVLQYQIYQVGFTFVNRSKEFDAQTSAQRFGAFSLSRKF